MASTGPARRARDRRILACLAATFLALAGTGCGRLDRDAIQSELSTVESAANEGMLVAQQASQARAPDNFVELRTAELGKEAKKAYEKLSGIPAEGDLLGPERDGAQVAARVARLLLTLHYHSENRQLAAVIAKQTQRLGERAAAIEDSL